MTKPLMLFLLCLCVSSIAHSQSVMMENRIPHQIFGAAVGGVLGGAVGGLTGRLLVGDNPEGFQDVAGVVVGALVGFTIGNGLGVYTMGNTTESKGRLWATMLGSTAGLVIGVGVGANMGEWLLPVAITSITAGSMLGYNMSRVDVRLSPIATRLVSVKIAM